MSVDLTKAVLASVEIVPGTSSSGVVMTVGPAPTPQIIVSDEAPENPSINQLWLDIS